MVPPPPSHLNASETLYWNRVAPTIDSLLDDLKKHQYIRSKHMAEESQQLLEIIKRANDNFLTWNAVDSLFDNLNNIDTIVNMKVGLTAANIRNLQSYYVIAAFLDTIELIRGELLYIIKRVKPFRSSKTLGPLLRALRKKFPKNGGEFADEIDVDLRNSLAHGTYWWTNEQNIIQLNYVSSLGDKPKSEPFDETIQRMRQHNLLGTCLSEVLSEKNRTGFFQ